MTTPKTKGQKLKVSSIRNKKAITLLDSWASDTSGYEKANSDKIEKTIAQDQQDQRKDTKRKTRIS